MISKNTYPAVPFDSAASTNARKMAEKTKADDFALIRWITDGKRLSVHNFKYVTEPKTKLLQARRCWIGCLSWFPWIVDVPPPNLQFCYYNYTAYTN